MERRLTTIVAADMVGYSRLVAANEEDTIDRLRALRSGLIDPVIAQHGGRIIKTMGDGLLLAFPSPVRALEAALAVQAGMARREQDRAEADRIAFRVGINLGDVIIDGDDILGDGVNIAARLEGLASPGGICLSETVHQQVVGKVDVVFVDLGPQEVKNIPTPVRAFAVAVDGQKPPLPARPRRKQLGLVAAMLALLALGLGGYLAVSQPRDAFAALPEVVAEPAAGSIIVLPFEDFSADQSLDHFADGMTEDLITDLARWKEFRVIARNTSMTYKGQPIDVRKVARETGTRYVLEGSIRKIGDQMRVTAQLIDGQTGNHVWAERFEKTGDDILALQDAAITQIVQTLIGNFGVIRESEYAETWAKAETSLEEYDYVLRGHSAFYRLTPEDNATAIRTWEAGLSKYPDSGLLKIKLGWGYYFAGLYGDAANARPKADILAMVSDSFADPKLAPAGHRFGLWLLSELHSELGHRKETISTVEQTMRSYPFDPEGLVYAADDLAAIGEYERALQLHQRVADLGFPLSANVLAERGALDYAMGDCTAAVPKLEGFPIELITLLFLAGCYAGDGRKEDAQAMLAKAAEVFGVLSPADFPTRFENMPGVTDRLTAQLAKVGWPE
jgi:TolB-like protein/class 3 adenylate cyclase